MRLIVIASIVTGVIPYILLTKGVLKGTIKQNFATWILWLILDSIVLKGTFEQHGNVILFSVFTAGTFVVTMILAFKKQFLEWRWFETYVAMMTAVCIGIYFSSGPYVATIASTIALAIAAIPQIVDTYTHPETSPTIANLFFAASSGFSIIGAKDWTVQERLPQTQAFCIIAIIVLLSIRKKTTDSEPEKDFYKDWHENGPINE